MLILSLVLSPTLSHANCDERIKACEGVLEKAARAIESQREYVGQLEIHNDRLRESLMDANDELDRKERWYNNPLVIGPVSFSVGIALVLLIGR